jgi:hypothetical protein
VEDLFMARTSALLEPQTDLADPCDPRQPVPENGQVSDRWEQRCLDLEAFKAEHGHCNVPQTYPADRSLAIWVTNCRRLRKQGKLDEQRIRRLDEIGFAWSLRTRRFAARDWDAMVAELAEFKDRHGHANVPHGCREAPELAAWLHGVRCSRRSGRLDADRVAQLDGLGVVWEPEQNRWEEMFAALVDFKKQEGHCNVPGTWTRDPKLAKWVIGLRAARKRNTLERERVEQLESLGFEWERGSDSRWDAMYDELTKYKRAHGHCRVSSVAGDHQKLGNWVRTQRTRFRQGALLQDQVRRLNELGFTWDLWRDQWEEMFSALVDFKTVFGHCDVPQAWAENGKLGNWVITQRSYYKKGRLDAEQIERLNAVGFRWSVAGDRLIAQPAKPEVTRRPETRPRRAA